MMTTAPTLHSEQPSSITLSTNKTSSLPQLPSELIEDVLGYLHDDRSSLRQCAQVSSSWLWPSRAHLFHHVHVGNGPQWDLLVDTLQSAPSIAPLIREFSASDHKRFLSDALARNTFIGSSMTGVQSLRIINATSLYPLNWTDVPAPNARHISLYRVIFKSHKDLFGFLTSRPFMQHLVLSAITVMVESSEAILNAPRVHHLEIDSSAVHALDSPDSTIVMRPLIMKVGFVDEDTIPVLARLLRRIGASLVTFCMTVHEIPTDTIWQDIPLDDALLSHSTHLKDLHLILVTKPFCLFGFILYSVLQHLKSAHLESIVLELRARDRAEMYLKSSEPSAISEFAQLQELTDLLEEPQFRHIKVFNVKVSFPSEEPSIHYRHSGGTITMDDLKQSVQAMFPLLHARGVLASSFFFPLDKGWVPSQ